MTDKKNSGMKEMFKEYNKAFEYLPLSIASGQARRQIKELIQYYTEWQELEERYIDIVLDLYDQLEKKKPGVTEEWIKDKITDLFVIFNILKPSSNDVGNADTFIRSIIRDAILMSTRR